uniref:Uncharacterized protein n=1 Tax=Cacopsylla melanoneura TaxID=428564 RepID=A0A8D8VZY8_9HEMI
MISIMWRKKRTSNQRAASIGHNFISLSRTIISIFLLLIVVTGVVGQKWKILFFSTFEISLQIYFRFLLFKLYFFHRPETEDQNFKKALVFMDETTKKSAKDTIIIIYIQISMDLLCSTHNQHLFTQCNT